MAVSNRLIRNKLSCGPRVGRSAAREVPRWKGQGDRARSFVRVIPLGILYELRQTVSWLAIARGRALGRIAAKLRLQLDEVGEDVGLAAQLVGDHRRLGGAGGGDGDPPPG